MNRQVFEVPRWQKTLWVPTRVYYLFTMEIYVILESPNLVYALPPWRRLQVSGHLLQELVIFLLYVSTAHFEKYLSKTNLGCSKLCAKVGKLGTFVEQAL